MDVFTKYGYFYEAWLFLRSMDIFTKHGSFSLRSMKRREGVFFAEGSKNGMYIKFHASQRSELQIIYILDSKICTSNITVLLQQSYIGHLKMFIQKVLVFFQDLLRNFIQQFIDDFVNNRLSHINDLQCFLRFWIDQGIERFRWRR
jgi:hypothetical protein